MAPRQSATAAVFLDEEQLAYGVVTNVSTEGACIVTGATLTPGTDVGLKLSFYRQPALIETRARIVWARRGTAREKALQGLRLHGLKFLDTPESHKTRLLRLLGSDAFVSLSPTSATEFDRLQSSLAAELEKLASKIDESIGGGRP